MIPAVTSLVSKQIYILTKKTDWYVSFIPINENGMSPRQQMKRRAYVLLFGGSLTSQAGCLENDVEPPTTLIDSITLRNRDEEEHELTLTIFDDETEVFTDTYHLAVGDPYYDVMEPAPVAGSGSYIVTAELAERDQEIDTRDFVETADTCVSLRITISEGGGFTPPSAMAYEECEHH